MPRRHAPGDDGDLMHRVLGLQSVDDHGVARLVVGGELPVPLDRPPGSSSPGRR